MAIKKATPMAVPKAKPAAPAPQAAQAAKPTSLDDYINEVKKRAYELYLGRGGNPGAEISDWVAAEKEVKAKYKIK